MENDKRRENRCQKCGSKLLYRKNNIICCAVTGCDWSVEAKRVNDKEIKTFEEWKRGDSKMTTGNISKLLSGRFILTIIGGLVFAYLACSKILPSEATMGILILIFEAYFHREDRPKQNGKGE